MSFVNPDPDPDPERALVAEIGAAGFPRRRNVGLGREGEEDCPGVHGVQGMKMENGKWEKKNILKNQKKLESYAEQSTTWR